MNYHFIHSTPNRRQKLFFSFIITDVYFYYKQLLQTNKLALINRKLSLFKYLRYFLHAERETLTKINPFYLLQKKNIAIIIFICLKIRIPA